MEEKQRKKVPVRKKGKKGFQAKRSALLKPATIILVVLSALLIILGLLYLARQQKWFTHSADRKATAIQSQEGQRINAIPTPVGPKKQIPESQLTEEYHNIPRQRPVHPVIEPGQDPLIAIIVDDLGGDLNLLQDFLRLDLNLTAAVLPNLPHAHQAAELAHNRGLEVLLHIPMEPKNYPQVDPGSEALMVKLSREVLQQRLREQIKAVPWAVGANNHMGSRFTENREGMQGVLEVLREKDLFFVDSRTTIDTVAAYEAEAMQVRSAERDIFLDNHLVEDEIRQQLKKLIKVARKQGSAIGICHPHKETLAALQKEISTFESSGVRIVPVSMLVH